MKLHVGRHGKDLCPVRLALKPSVLRQITNCSSAARRGRASCTPWGTRHAEEGMGTGYQLRANLWTAGLTAKVSRLGLHQILKHSVTLKPSSSPCLTWAVSLSGIPKVSSSRVTKPSLSVSWGSRYPPGLHCQLCIDSYMVARFLQLTACKRRWRLARRECEGSRDPGRLAGGAYRGPTHHDDHQRFDTSPDTGGLVLFSEPVKSSGDRGVFFGLSFSLTALFSLAFSGWKGIADIMV